MRKQNTGTILSGGGRNIRKRLSSQSRLCKACSQHNRLPELQIYRRPDTRQTPSRHKLTQITFLWISGGVEVHTFSHLFRSALT